MDYLFQERVGLFMKNKLTGGSCMLIFQKENMLNNLLSLNYSNLERRKKSIFNGLKYKNFTERNVD